MTLAQMQARFFEVKGKLAVGQITEQEFKHALEQLRFQDRHGRWWMIGAQSGRWYYYNGARWMLGEPPDPGAPGLDGGETYPSIPPTTSRAAPYAAPQASDANANDSQTISAPYSYAPTPVTPSPQPAAYSYTQTQAPPPQQPASYSHAATSATPQQPASYSHAPTPSAPPAQPAPRSSGNGYRPRYVAPDPVPAAVANDGRQSPYSYAQPTPVTQNYARAATAQFAPQYAAQTAPPNAAARPSLGESLHQELGKVRMPHVQVPHVQRPNLHAPHLHVPPQFVPHAPGAIRKYQPPFILAGAVLIGFALVALLWLAVDNFVPGKPISSIFARGLGQPNARPSVNRQSPPVAGGQNVENLLRVGDEYATKSQYEIAVTQYQAAAKQSPNKADVYWHWARALALTGRIGEAIVQAEKATRLDPTSANAFAELARAYAWAGENGEAIGAGEKAISLDSENATAQAFLAEAYLRAGRNGEAQQTIDKALELDDLNPETHRVAGWVSILSGRKDDGVSEWNRVIELAPDIFLYHYEFGLIYINHLNDPEMAIPAFQRAIDLYPSYIPSYVALGRAYLSSNQPAPGILQFQRALTLDPNSTDAFVGLGQAFQAQQKCPQAIPYFQKALDLNKQLALASKGLEDCGALTKGSAPQIAPTAVAIVPLATAIAQATVAPAASNPSQTKATPIAGPAAVNPKGKGRIYFPVYDGQYRVFSANPDGSDRRLVVELASSPMVNGSRMLFYSWESNQRGIHRIGTNGADDTYISLRAEDTLPAWSPDGAKYAYSTRAGQGGDINKRAYTIRVASVGSRPRNDPAPLIEQAQYPAWGPTGQIVYRDCGFPDDQCGLAIVNADGSGKKNLTNINSTAPTWSPDGMRIIFMSNAAGNWDLYAISANGGSPERLTDDLGNDGLPTYAPDGSKIAFVSRREGKWSVWQIDPDGENEVKLFDLDGDIAGPVPGNSPAQPGQSWLEQRISWR